DTGDPPDTLAADVPFSFTTIDTAPSVTTTVPVDTTTHVATNAAIAVNWDEPVTVTTSSFTLDCPTGTPKAFTVGGSGTAASTLTPSASLPEGVVCTVSTVPANISDVDTVDPPDHPTGPTTFSFTVDQTPTVQSTTPANNASGVALNSTITVNFS